MSNNPADWGAVAPDRKDSDAGPAAWGAKAVDLGGENASSLVPAAVADIPKEAVQATKDAASSVATNLVGNRSERLEKQLQRDKEGAGFFDTQAFKDQLSNYLDTGKAALSAIGLPLAPAVGAARSVIGHTMASLTHKVGKIIAPEIADKQDPQKLYEDAKSDVDTALSAAAPRGFTTRGAITPKPAPPPTQMQNIAEASERLGVPIPKAAATDSLPTQMTAGALKEVPIVGSPLVKASKKALDGLDEAGHKVAAQYGSGDIVTAGEAAKDGLENWITGKSGDIAKRVYDRVDKLVDQTFTRPLHATGDVVSEIMAHRARAKIGGKSAAVNEVLDAVKAPGGLDYQGLKDLRTYIRDLTPEEMVAKGISKTEAKRIYGALTEDLRGTILDAGGPPALAAFDRANHIFSIIADRRAGLAKIIGVKADAAPERVMDRMMQLAGSKGGADLTKLTQARRAIGPEKWNEVTSAVVNRMGRAAPDADFSGDRFVTAWNAMSDNGKRVLFNSTGRTDLAKSVEDMMTLSKAHRNLTRFGNPSGTGRVGTLTAAGAGAVAAPFMTLVSVLGGNVTARILASPVMAKKAANWTNAYVNAVQSGSPAAQNALIAASARLVDSVGRNITINPAASLPSLQSPATAGANENSPESSGLIQH